MIRYFICENCHHGYEADDAGNVNCPYCNSDNVRPARNSSGALKYVAMVLVFVLCCGVGFFIPKLINGGSEEINGGGYVAQISGSDGNVSTVDNQVRANTVVDEVSIKDTTVIPIITNVSKPVMKGETYSFKVTVNVPSGDKALIYLMEEFGTEPIATSTDGNFQGVAAIVGGVYKVVAENVKTKDRSAEKFVNGCLPVQKVVQLTQSQIQDAFNSGSIPTKDFMARFTSSPKINVVGMDETEPQVTNVGEVFNRIASGLWMSVTVSNVKYADDNRVNSFTITVTY